MKDSTTQPKDNKGSEVEGRTDREGQDGRENRDGQESREGVIDQTNSQPQA